MLLIMSDLGILLGSYRFFGMGNPMEVEMTVEVPVEQTILDGLSMQME